MNKCLEGVDSLDERQDERTLLYYLSLPRVPSKVSFLSCDHCLCSAPLGLLAWVSTRIAF